MATPQPIYFHLVDANTNLAIIPSTGLPSLNLDAETRRTILNAEPDGSQPDEVHRERQLFFTRMIPLSLATDINLLSQTDIMDFTLCLFIYAYYKNKNKNFRILQVQLSANNTKQIERHIYEGEYKLEPDNTGGFANVSFDYMSVIAESALLSYFNLYFFLKSKQNTDFENLKFDESTQQYQHDINTNKFVLVDIVPEVN